MAVAEIVFAAKDQVTGTLNKIQSGVSGFASSMASRLGAAFSVAAVARFVKGAIDSAEAIKQTADATGLATGEVIAFQDALRGAGVKAERAAGLLAKFVEYQKKSGNESKSTAQALREFAMELNSAEGSTKALSMASEAFGTKVSVQMLDALKSLGDGLGGIDDGSAQAVEALSEVDQALDSLKNRLADFQRKAVAGWVLVAQGARSAFRDLFGIDDPSMRPKTEGYAGYKSNAERAKEQEQADLAHGVAVSLENDFAAETEKIIESTNEKKKKADEDAKRERDKAKRAQEEERKNREEMMQLARDYTIERAKATAETLKEEAAAARAAAERANEQAQKSRAIAVESLDQRKQRKEEQREREKEERRLQHYLRTGQYNAERGRELNDREKAAMDYERNKFAAIDEAAVAEGKEAQATKIDKAVDAVEKIAGTLDKLLALK